MGNLLVKCRVLKDLNVVKFCYKKCRILIDHSNVSLKLTVLRSQGLVGKGEELEDVSPKTLIAP